MGPAIVIDLSSFGEIKVA